MICLNKILTKFSNFFRDKGYGESLQEYVVRNNPQNPADIEFLERKWHYSNSKNTGGHWL